MSESEEGSIIIDAQGEHHYRKVSTEDTQAEADTLCETLNEQGYASAQFPLADGRIEVFTKFGLEEEIQFLLEEQCCSKCPPEKKLTCEAKPMCWVKKQLDDATFDAQHGWFFLLKHKLAKLRKEGVPKDAF